MTYAMDKQFKMWCHSDDYKAWEEAARLSKKSLSKWARDLMSEAAAAKIESARSAAANKTHAPKKRASR